MTSTSNDSRIKLFITPDFTRPDNADGGIRRCVEAQKRYLPSLGIDVVSSEDAADLVAIHAGSHVDTLKPTVAHCHGLYWNEYDWANWALELNIDVIKVMKNAMEITVPSKWVGNAVARGMWRTPWVLYHGIDTEEWKPLAGGSSHEDYVLWNKTRLDPVCDVTPVNELARRMQVQRFVSTYGESDLANLVVTGPLPHAQAKTLVQKAGVYLCTTRETFGIGTIEAMACGVPIVGWNWGGQAEFVEHGKDGWLCNPGDYDGLAKGIQYCLANRAEMGKAARQKILREFTWSKAILKYAQVYNAALYNYNRPGPKVSVIIPCYKLEQYLFKAVDSIVDDKSFTDYEIIVVNDNSPTWANDLEEALASIPQVKVLITPQNLYLAGALNYGIEHSTGKYIINLDADNMLHPGTLATLAGELDKYPSLDIAYGKVKFINPDGSPDTSVAGDGISPWPPETFSYSRQMHHQNQIPSTSMYRRWVWERSGGYRRRWRTAEDADFWCRATSIGAIPAKVTDAVTLIYRQREDSMSRVEQQKPWEAWYPWSVDPNLTPFAAPRDDTTLPSVQSYDPIVIDVVIPVGPGHEEIVVDAVDSIIAQSYQKWSITVVNDTGNNLARLPSFVRVVDTPKPGSGPAIARNVGIRQGRASLFLPLDADDILAPTALQDMLDAMDQEGGYIYSDWMVQESGTIHSAPDFNTEDLKQSLFHAVTCLYQRRSWEEVGGFDEHLDGWEDWDFALSLCAAGYCGTRVPKPLLQYRMASGTIREKLVGNKDKYIANMRAKWTEDRLMGCSSCGNGGGSVYEQAIRDAIPPAGLLNINPGDTSDLVLIQFTPEGQGMRTYLGQSTGKEYYFGSGDDSVRYVHKSDLPSFLNLMEFQLYTGSTVNTGVVVS